MNPRPFWNPYLGGVLLGLVLLGSFLVVGQGLGASGAATRVAVGAAHVVAPAATVTGGGTLLLADLLTVPGASATVLDARIPYANAALAEFIGAVPEQADENPGKMTIMELDET